MTGSLEGDSGSPAWVSRAGASFRSGAYRDKYTGLIDWIGPFPVPEVSIPMPLCVGN